MHAYRQAIGATCALSALDDPSRFRAQCRVYHLGAAVLADVRSSSLRYLRAARHVARGAYDHYQITLNLSGQIHYRSARQSVIARPSDVVIVDSARETDARAQAPDRGLSHALALFVPRAELAPLLRAPGGGHLLRLSGELSLARAARDHLSRLLQTIESEAPDRVGAVARGLIGLLAGDLSRPRSLLPVGRDARRSTIDSLERFIERRLDSPALSLDLLCSHSGCSRATVYRLLEAEGGPIRYIRQRRLERAFRELICGGAFQGRIRELALRHRFASEATFNRAFRRTFGLPPGEVREIAAHSRRAVLAGGAADVGGAGADRLGHDDAEAIDWIRTLGDAASAVRPEDLTVRF
ncbi:MAG: helix-turn-helix domain-containing protein [Steroidobacteraceae bacterium]